MIDLDNVYAAWDIACEKQEWAEFKTAMRRKFHNGIEFKWTPTTLTINGTLVLTTDEGVIPSWLILEEDWMQSLLPETVDSALKYINDGVLASIGGGDFAVLKSGTINIPGLNVGTINLSCGDNLKITPGS